MHDISFDAWSGAPVDLFMSVNPIYTDLRRGLVKYRQRWGRPAAVPIPAGPALKTGLDGRPRRRCFANASGLPPATNMTPRWPPRSRSSSRVHGSRLTGSPAQARSTRSIAAPNYYEQLIIINMERAKRLPAPEEQRKYAVVDAGGARLSLWENGRKVDEMKVVVGKAETATPMMAAYIKYASVNPYWNVPPELVQNLIAPRVAAQGVSYLTDREYQVLTDYGDNAQTIDPQTVDWQARGRRARWRCAFAASPARPIRWA